jgi:hypothetical protein
MCVTLTPAMNYADISVGDTRLTRAMKWRLTADLDCRCGEVTQSFDGHGHSAVRLDDIENLSYGDK